MLEQRLARMDTFIVGRRPGKNSFNAWWKSMLLPKVWLSDCVIYAISVLSFIGSVCAPDKASLKAEPPVYHSRTVQRNSLFFTSGRLHLWTWPWCGWHSLYQFSGSLSSCSMLIHSPQRSRKSQCSTRTQLHSFVCSFSRLGTSFLSLPWLFTRRMLLTLFAVWTVTTLLTKLHETKSRKLPPVCFWTRCVHKTLLVLLLAVPRESWTDQSSSCCWHHASHEKSLMCFSPWVTRWFPSHSMGCVLHGDFTLLRTFTPSVLDALMNLTLSHYNECPRLYNIFLSFWRHGTILPPRNCSLHDLISRVFLRSLQYGIVVLDFLDALVNAHHKHRLDSASAGSFGDCLRGRVRFMTAITPAYAHAYQTLCLAMHSPCVPRRTFRLPKPKSRYPFLPNVRSITREVGNEYHGWAICAEGGTRVVNGEIFAGWCVISRSPRGRIFVLTNEAHPAFSGARIHSNNTAGMTAMFEALSFPGPGGLVTHDEQSRFCYDFVHAVGICLARSRSEHTYSWRKHVNNLWYALNTGYGSPCNMCLVTVEIWETNVLIMPLHLAHLDSSLAIMSPRVGLVTNLTPLYVLMAVTTSAKLLNDYNSSEPILRRDTRTEFSIGISHRVLWAVGHLTSCIAFCFVLFVYCGSEVSAFSALLLANKWWIGNRHPCLPNQVSTITLGTICGILC